MTPLGLLAGSIILGLIWGIWHLPLFFMPDTWHGQIGFGLTGFWMFMHFTSNFTSQLVAPASARFEVIEAIILFVVSITVWLLMNRQSRKMMQLDAAPAR